MKLFSFFKHRQLAALEKTSTSAVVLAIQNASKKGDYASFKQYINNAPLDIIVELSHKSPDSRFIQQYAREFPQNADAHFLYGNHLINSAWQAKKKSAYKEKPIDQSTTTLRFLNAAYLELATTLQLKPDYLPAFALLIKIQREQKNKKRAQAIYQQAKKLAPTLLDYHSELMILLSPTWEGSNKNMFDFAYKCAQKDPTGILHGLIPIVHFEYWYTLNATEAKRYITNKRVKKEIRQAYLEVENAELDDTYYQQYQYYIALNYFALLFLLMEDKDKAKLIFNRIAGRYTHQPWATIEQDQDVALTYLHYKKFA